jgi:hypothetical protein
MHFRFWIVILLGLVAIAAETAATTKLTKEYAAADTW